MSDPTPASFLGQVPVCGQRALLPRHLISAALAFATCGSASPRDVEKKLRCPLETHVGEHHGFVMHLDGVDTGSVWTSWTDGQLPEIVTVRDDCDAVSSRERGRQSCCEFAGHPGAHTYDVDDPLLVVAP